MSEEIIQQLEEDENNQPKIKQSDQYFIQQNYKHVPLEYICTATELSPQEVTAYIEEYEEYLRSQNVNPDRKFNFSIGLDQHGSVSYLIEWPDVKSVESIMPYVGKFFYLLNSGALKNSMVQFLGRYAEDKGAYSVVKEILNVWNENEKSKKETPIVSPSEVFVNQ